MLYVPKDAFHHHPAAAQAVNGLLHEVQQASEWLHEPGDEWLCWVPSDQV